MSHITTYGWSIIQADASLGNIFVAGHYDASTDAFMGMLLQKEQISAKLY
jgi:hypothetical protein